MKKIFLNAYSYCVTIPDRLYPFRSQIEGQRVRGQRSYQVSVEKAHSQYGLGKLGYKLTFYREVFHFLGSLLFIVFSTLVAKDLFGSDIALYVLLGAAVLALSYQEFYLHPKAYGQHPRKGMTDWLVWVAPMVAYLTLFR